MIVEASIFSRYIRLLPLAKVEVNNLNLFSGSVVDILINIILQELNSKELREQQ